jgi:hypothetical protein
VFIFSSSAQSGEVSGGISDAVTELVNRGLEGLGLAVRLTGLHIRKLAHFAEFALLGFLMIPALRTYTRRVAAHISWPLCFGLAVPVLDEGLQLLVPGRSGQLTDVLLDSSGSCAGILLGLVLLALTRKFWESLRIPG